MDNHEVTNVVFAGLGGQGVLKASDILALAVFNLGYDVKKSEIHGMSQRGGSVTSDVRYGKQVLSPMIPEGEAQFLLVLESTQVEPTKHMLRPDGVLLVPEDLLEEGQTFDDLDKDESSAINRRTLNVAMIGMLSSYLDLPDEEWMKAVYANLPKKVHELNTRAFAAGKAKRKKG